MARRFDAVFFDMGFTLLYFYPSLPALTLRAFREAGFDVNSEALAAAEAKVVASFRWNNAGELFEATKAADDARELELRRSILSYLGLDGEEALQRFVAHEEAVFSEPGAMRLFPEVPEVLATLQERGYRLGIISNWSWNLRQRCDQLGITNAFEVIMASAYAGCLKPNPCIFQQALAQMGVPAERAIHIGDDYRADVLGARQSGIEGVLVLREGPPPMAECVVIRDLRELYPVLEGG